jgi:hypothetical protein
MNTVHMKIVGYDDLSHSLLVCFASDTTKFQDPEKYPPIAFQPSIIWPDVTDAEEIKKLIAQAGVAEAKRQETQEKFIENLDQLNAIKSMVGQESSYPSSSLFVSNQFSNEVSI